MTAFYPTTNDIPPIRQPSVEEEAASRIVPADRTPTTSGRRSGTQPAALTKPTSVAVPRSTTTTSTDTVWLVP
jgi:hypothetical protein